MISEGKVQEIWPRIIFHDKKISCSSLDFNKCTSMKHVVYNVYGHFKEEVAQPTLMDN